MNKLKKYQMIERFKDKNKKINLLINYQNKLDIK